MTAAIILGAILAILAILATVVTFALGVYFGHQHGREQREEVATELSIAHAVLDEFGETYDRGVAERFRPAFSAIPGAQVYDHAEEGL